MAASWRTLRVFISSTFLDMQAERDHLVRFVFPRLRETLAGARLHLVDVDLRWGVTTDQDSVAICREVIDECHPRFLGMLGGRYGWIPPGDEKSITADEIHYGVLAREAMDRRHAFFYFRDEEATARMPEPKPGTFRDPEGSSSARRLAALKEVIVEAGLPTFPYGAAWDPAQGRLTSLESFGDHVFATLLESIRLDPDLADRFSEDASAPVDPFAEERDAMEAFIEDRTERYVTGSRQPLLDAMRAFASTDGSPNILVIEGEPGSGKSSLLGKCCRALEARPGALIVRHFAGASAGSTDLRRTLRRLCHEMAADTGHTDSPPDDVRELIDLFRDLLGKAAAVQRVVLVIDAINQLDAAGGAHEMGWLPRELPSNVRVIISSLEHPALEALRSRGDIVRREKLTDLTESDARTIVDGFLRRYSKRFSNEQISALLTKPEAHLPLYLLTALNELRTLGTYEEITRCIADLPGETKPLFGWILKERLSNDPGFRDAERRPCGPALVAKFASYLGVSRHGLSSRELVGLIDPGDPLGNVAALLRLVRPYLMHRGELLDFFHGQLREAVHENFLPGPVPAHSDLANYFVAIAKGSEPTKEWETVATRGFSECVFHLTRARQYEPAEALLSCFPFILRKLRLGLLDSALEDYEMFRREAPGVSAKRVEAWTDFFRENGHILRRGNTTWPAHKILLQIAIEHSDESPPTQAAETWLAEGRCDWLWLRRVERPLERQKSGCLAVLEGHTREITDTMFLSDGRLLSWSFDGSLRFWDVNRGVCLAVGEGHGRDIREVVGLPDGRLLSRGGNCSDLTLRLWDAQTGACLAACKGHADTVDGVMVLDNERLLSWGSWNDPTLRVWNSWSGLCGEVMQGHTGTIKGVLRLGNDRVLAWTSDVSSTRDYNLRIWDLGAATCVAVLKGHTQRLEDAVVLGNGRLLSWAAPPDNTMRLWDARTGASVAVLEGHSGAIQGARAWTDGRVLSWSADNSLRLWDGQSGRCVAVLEGHNGSITGVLTLADGRLLSWSKDQTLRLWDGRSGTCLAVLQGHAREVKSALELPDGRLLSWSYDGTLRIWDSVSGACLAVLQGHTDYIGRVVVLGDGRLLSSSEDHTFRIWDGRSGACLAVLEGHTDRINGQLILNDGRLVSWSSDQTIRIWDCASGECFAVLEGHKGGSGSGHVRALSDGRLISWWRGDSAIRIWDSGSRARQEGAEDRDGEVKRVVAPAPGRFLSQADSPALRLWDGESGVCLAVLEGHEKSIKGILPLSGGRALSWSRDKTLRIWDGRNGTCLAVLEGHGESVEGVLVLNGGRLLSWAGYSDNDLRIWNSESGACLVVLKGHRSAIQGAGTLSGGRLLSWGSEDRHMYIRVYYCWDGQTGELLESLTEDYLLEYFPEKNREWNRARLKAEADAETHGCAAGDFCVDSESWEASNHLRHQGRGVPLCAWNSDPRSKVQCLELDGTLVVTKENGEVCILKLFYGNRRMTLAEVKALLRGAGQAGG